jgi:tripartite ATP-independent transporter DctM subunit
MLIVYLHAKKNNLGGAHERSTFKAICKELMICLPALLVPIIILAGIAFGIFTATEAAMIAAVYCLFIAMFIYKSIKISSLFRLFKESAMGSAPCLFCIGSAGVFGWMLAYVGIPDKLMKLMSPFVTGPISCLLILTVLFIIVGMFMDALPAIVIFQPIVTAMTKAVGLNPMHVAIVVVLVLCFGLMTPPYGITLLLSAQMAGTRSLSVTKVLLPFYVVFLVVVLITIFFPESALWLPRLLMPTSFR